jgi:hypothetical protein
MRYIKLRLKNNSFWGIHELDLFLNSSHRISDVLDLGSLEPQIYDIIIKSVKLREVEALSLKGEKVSNLSKEITDIDECDISDVIEEDQVYDVVSATLPSEEKIVIEPFVSDYEKASKLLERNGNTIKKTIGKLQQDKDSIRLLKACLELEKKNKNRDGVLVSVMQRLRSFDV